MRSFCLTIFFGTRGGVLAGRCGSGRSAADKPDASGAGNGARQCAEQSCVHPVSAGIRAAAPAGTRHPGFGRAGGGAHDSYHGRHDRWTVGGSARNTGRRCAMIRVVCVAMIMSALAAGVGVTASAELPPPSPAPYGPAVAPGQLPALNVSRGTRLPSSMSGARGPRMSGG